MSASIVLRDGNLYLDAATFARYLGAREAVTLVRRDDDLYVVPLLDSSLGGYLCKRRTAAGDRVVNAQDFFRDHGFDGPVSRELRAEWRTDVAALVVARAFEVR